MSSTLAGVSPSEAPSLFSTPVARVQSVALRHTHTHATPTTPRLPTRPCDALAEMKTVNSFLQALAEQLHSWAIMSPPTGPHPHPGTAQAHVLATTGDACAAHHDAPCEVLPWRAPGEQDAFFVLQTVIENTRRLVAQCQSEVRVLVGRCRGSSPSGATSGHASCGLSYTESPSDGPTHRLSADGEGSRWAAEEQPRGAIGSALPAATAVPQGGDTNAASCAADRDGRGRMPDGGGVTVAAAAETRTPDESHVQHPQRRAWPSQQFCYMTHVEFKRRRVRRFVSPVPVKPGTYVIVPGDRGYDCGLVVQCAMWNPYRQSFEAATIQKLDPGVLSAGHCGTIMEVIRVATDEEVQRLHCEHVSMERLALTTCREIADRLHLQMEVLDCEYQFDGTKISFFFDAAEAIDFRQLNKALFRVFNARIWMQNINCAVRNGGPPCGSTATRHTGVFRCGFRGNPSTPQ